jgi:hypothetical protein
MGRAYSMHGAKQNAYKILVQKPEGKILQGRPSHRWEGNMARSSMNN